MSIRLVLNHLTHYKFDRAVSLSPHIIRLRPAPHTRTPIESYTMKVWPEEHFINWQQDPFGNYLARLVFPEKATELKIEVEVIARLEAINPFDFFLEESAEKYPFTYSDRLLQELGPYLEVQENGVLLRALLAQVDRSEQITMDFLVAVNQLVNKRLRYSIRMQPGVQTCEETLLAGIGSCRDFAWLMVQMLRHLGIAARFVSGYSVQLKPDQKPLEGPAGVGEDVTDLHAWVEAYVPGAGWVGMDATSGLLAAEGHIPLACVPHYASAAAIEGLTDVCEVEFNYENRVKRLFEDPRVTKPYTTRQWEEIEALGRQVDEDLVRNDVRLTMGGEPTFVSVDDMEAAEWNTAADGTHKRALGWDLATRLRDQFGPGGILHYAQGKWYPGEPLPRWAFGIIWRKDQQPIWNHPHLLDRPSPKEPLAEGAAFLFARTLTENLGFAAGYLLPAYEDILHLLLEEGQVPLDEDPMELNLEDPLERQALARKLSKGVKDATGYVLPIGWSFKSGDWQSSRWEFRRGHLFLMPGNSPIGLRLPLDALPDTVEEPVGRSMLEDLPELDVRDASEIALRNDQTRLLPLLKTALCIEERMGTLYIFMPPLSYLEHYLELVRVIEKTAVALAQPLVLEGYPPPDDYRAEKISVTPDPGVIEVNIHPAQSWSDMVRQTGILYDQARLSRLSTEKFMVDGRHVGTGGGNHVTLGAARPVDSPFLRRPDLLQSMLTYWQHHPSLSYLFSSAFIGPTSQAPRIDEGRDDRLYEIEIAFSQVPGPDDPKPPLWMVDRIFRNLLTDLTGNTHRAEFCIDKLYSPDSVNGRLGILEMRGIEMPPHKEMSLVQMLLIRTLVSRFWKEPYRHKLVRWGTGLYDKFLLPHYCRKDVLEVVEDLRRHGYHFDPSWLDPFFEFRFPRYGSVQVKDIEIEIRMGIEPWHVLGEELSNRGTARFVDSSLERVQVKLTGLSDSRYQLLCNGYRVPLTSTGTQGEYVAGVRYRAWQPPSALHPTIGIDAPLVFDLIDTWNKQVIGGCTYHVSHPGGRAYETFPVNALEAESRRINRFQSTDYTPSAIEFNPASTKVTDFRPHTQSKLTKNEEILEIENAEFPYTLDLRLARSHRT